MNLQLVTGRKFSCACVACKRRLEAGTDSREHVYADLDGRAFVDYYCALCAGDARAAAVLCPRTLAIYKPGVPMPGVTHAYAYGGDMPCTGPLVCALCGERAP